MVGDDKQFERIHHLLQKQARQQPDAVLLYEEGGGTVSYGEMWRRAGAARDWLESQGVRPGDRVVVVGENCSEMVQCLFACSLLGAWQVGVNGRLSGREIDAIRTHADPALTLYLGRVSSAVAEHARAQADVHALPDLGAGLGNFWVAAARRPQPETGALAAGVGTVIYTSGTTGSPKGVLVPHKGLIHFARVSAASRRLGPDDISYAALPMSHIFGIATVLMASVYAGASLVVRRRFDVADVLASLESPGLTTLQGVPTMFTRILEACPSSPPAPGLRYLYAGGSPLDPTLKRNVESLFHLPIHHGYGITEYAGSLYVTNIDAPRSDCSSGYPVEGVELRIGDLDQEPNASGQQGPILVRGPGVMLGYYRDPDQTAQALLPGGWLNTGDLGYVDDDGALFITGRSKDLIIRSGFNVYPIEVESVINTYPGVKLSAVVGKVVADQNEEVVAFIEPQAGSAVDAHDLTVYLKARLAPYKVPARVIPLETIPTTVSGKIKKQPLREMLNQPAP